MSSNSLVTDTLRSFKKRAVVRLKRALGIDVTGGLSRFERLVLNSTWRDHDSILLWANQRSAIERNEEEVDEERAAVIQKGRRLKAKIEEAFRNKYKSQWSGKHVVIHTPPLEISPGGNSVFRNLIESLRYLGVESSSLLWNDETELVLRERTPYMLLTSDSTNFLERICWESIKKYRKNHTLLVGLTASLEAYGNSPLLERLRWARENGVDFYYSFRSPEYLKERADYQPFYDCGYNIFSVEFGANPLTYYPVPCGMRDLDYVFLASSNRAKRERYFAYLPPIVSKHHGFIDGPGWSRIAKYAPPHTHRFLYSRAKVGLNLHISDSIDWPSELNERTYILAACGVPQLVDQAKLIERRFSEGSMFVADTPQDYCAMFEHMLTNPAEAGLVALSALEDVFNRHTTFHRADAFLSALQNAGLLKD